MDFSGRNVQSQSPTPSVQRPLDGPPPSSAGRKHKVDKGKWGRIGVVLALLAVVILLVGVIVVVSQKPKTEDSYVDTHKLQAVFLNTGQVYFGNIKTLNNKYFVLTNIYYLQTNNSNSSSSSSSNSNTNVTLVKLGCELHEPYDQMVINSSQVTFWENLQDGGQVAKAVKTFQQDNPNGQKCSDQSSSSGSTSNTAQPANGSNPNSSNSSNGSTNAKP